MHKNEKEVTTKQIDCYLALALLNQQPVARVTTVHKQIRRLGTDMNHTPCISLVVYDEIEFLFNREF